MTEAKRRLLAAQAMSDVAAAQCAIVVRLADSVGIFAALQGRSGMTPGEMAQTRRLPHGQVESILATLAASGYVDFDPLSGQYSLSPAQKSLFADENDPLFMGGAFQLALGLARDDQDEIAQGISRSSRAKFPSLVARRLAARLERAKQVAEIGCASGAILIEIARRYPNVRAFGIDRSESAIARARVGAEEAGLHERVSFIVGEAGELDTLSCDVILCLEALHEFADPVQVARAAFAALRAGGVWFMIEPCADRSEPGNDRRFLASLASLHCLPAANFSPDALGPLANRGAYKRVITAGGFEHFKMESDGPIHVVIEATR